MPRIIAAKGFLQSLLSVSFFLAGSALAFDTDADGVSDSSDNCLLAVNPAQIDSDADGYGNFCDGDFNNDLRTDFLDLGILRLFFFASAPYSQPVADSVDMNSDGRIDFLDLGLLKAAFQRAPGPSAANGSFDSGEAARFLTQTTFGPTLGEIQALATAGDPEAWLEGQFAVAPSSHEILTRLYASWMCFDTPATQEVDGYYEPSRQAAWWAIALNGEDQLRQRVAFALSEILVVADTSDLLGGSQYAIADYYDMLAEHAFGNYRDLLQNVTLHATMGSYLSMVRNERAQPSLNIRPDENYARELLQLFSIGVHVLNLDGSKVLDQTGNPIATYDQADIEQLARVFTGWNYAGISWYEWPGLADRTLPMVAFEQFHDTDPKVLLGGEQLPGGQNAIQDLNAALDNVFEHPNVGPFLARLLIQRLVTSNPTPGYIARVASAFNNDGNGVRGDMKAVLRAILLDPEARQGHIYLPNRFGKLREPVLRMSHMRRAFAAVPVAFDGDRWTGEPCGQPTYYIYPSPFGPLQFSLGQQPQRAPSVFNFFQPDYAPPGPVRDNGLVAPEFQLFTTSLAPSTAGAISFEIQNNGIWGPGWVGLTLDQEIALAADPNALLDHLNLLLASGQLSDAMFADLLAHLNDPSLPTDNSRDEVRARDAIMLIALSPEYLIQR